MPVPFKFQQQRQERPGGQRAAAAPRASCIDDLCVAALAAHRQPQPRPGPVPDEQRHHHADPAEPRRVALLRPGHRERRPARLRRALPRPAGALRRAVGQRASCPASTRAPTSTTPTSTRSRWSRTCATAPLTPPPSAGSSTCCAELNARARGRARRRPAPGGPHPGDGDRLPHADRGDRRLRHQPRAGAGPRRVRPRPLRQRAACWPGGWPSAASASCRSTTATASPGTRTATTTSTTRKLLPDIDRPMAALLTDLKRARPARRHARRLGRRVRPHPDLRERRRPRPQPLGLHDVAGRRRRARAAWPTAPPTSSASAPSQDKVHVHDLHATILHLLGLDHEKLTYRYAGRDFRLTDVYGQVVSKILKA